MSAWTKILVVIRVIVVAVLKDQKAKDAFIQFMFHLFGLDDLDVFDTAKLQNCRVRQYKTLPDSLTMFERCAELGLIAREGFYTMPPEDFARTWNGMGPDAWRSGLREWISQKLDAVLPCSGPHDDWYAHGNDGTFETWKRTQGEWITNSRKCLAAAAKKSGWFRRAVNWYRAQLCIQLLQLGGFSAWKAAHMTAINSAIERR